MNRPATRTPRLATPSGQPNEQNVYTKAGLASLIEHIKRDARRMTKEVHEDGDITHCQALEILSQRNGFKSYAALQAAWKAVS